jgi:DNA-binding IclR family transcriptional regulator
VADEDSQSGGIKSLDAALRVLASMSAQNGPLPLSEIARACKMPPSKVHRYLASFLRAGLVKQEGPSGRYDLGPGAMQLGLAAIARHDFVNHTAGGLPELSAETGMTVLLSVWGNGGATVVRWERGISPTVTSMGLGTTLPLLNSATGRAFLAWAPPAQIAKLRDTELRRAARNPALLHDFRATAAGIDELIGEIRARGYASVDGRFIPGLVAAAAPVLDWQHEAQAVVTLVGTDPLDIEPGSGPIQGLLAFCAGHSVTRAGS